MSERGQATVEAAFLLPMLLFMMALLIQPALLLYGRCVMTSTAAETCRLVATTACGDEAIDQFVRRRLASIPRLEILHSESCGWNVSFEADVTRGKSSVAIEGHTKALPLLGLAAGLTKMTAGDGCLLERVESSCSLQPDWAQQEDESPEDWISRWR